jgi:hypothetical protein
MWQEEVMASWPNLKVLSLHLAGGTEVSHEASVRIAGLRVDI